MPNKTDFPNTSHLEIPEHDDCELLDGSKMPMLKLSRAVTPSLPELPERNLGFLSEGSAGNSPYSYARSTACNMKGCAKKTGTGSPLWDDESEGTLTFCDDHYSEVSNALENFVGKKDADARKAFTYLRGADFPNIQTVDEVIQMEGYVNSAYNTCVGLYEQEECAKTLRPGSVMCENHLKEFLSGTWPENVEMTVSKALVEARQHNVNLFDTIGLAAADDADFYVKHPNLRNKAPSAWSVMSGPRSDQPGSSVVESEGSDNGAQREDK